MVSILLRFNPQKDLALFGPLVEKAVKYPKKRLWPS